MKHNILPKGFDSIKDVAKSIMELDEPRAKFFFYLLGDSFESQAINDEKMGYCRLCGLGFELAYGLFEMCYNSVIREDDYLTISIFSDEVGHLRYDSLIGIFTELHDFSTSNYLRESSSSLENIIKKLSMMDEISRKYY
jgi:hypothetical protein